MKAIQWIRGLIFSNSPMIVTFTGGMGAQIISAAIYFYLKNEGHVVYADMSYFDKEENIATVTSGGGVSLGVAT